MVSYALNKIKQKKNILSKNLLQVYEYIIYIEYRIYNNIYKKKKYKTCRLLNSCLLILPIGKRFRAHVSAVSRTVI